MVFPVVVFNRGHHVVCTLDEAGDLGAATAVRLEPTGRKKLIFAVDGTPGVAMAGVRRVVVDGKSCKGAVRGWRGFVDHTAEGEVVPGSL